MKSRQSQRGSAMLVVTVIVIAVTGMSAAFLTISWINTRQNEISMYQLQALPEYDVSKLYVCESSLTQRGLALKDLVLPVVLVPLADQAMLVADQDVVVND